MSGNLTMTYKQRRLVEWMEHNVAHLDLHGRKDLAKKMSDVIEFLYKDEPVWAVIMASVHELGPVFVDRLRKAFYVGRVE